MLAILLVVLFFGAVGQTPTQTSARHELREVKLEDTALLKLVGKGKQFGLPQLRVYDRDGRQVADFGEGFDSKTFASELEKVLRSPSPLANGKTLETEIKDFLEKDGKPLAKLNDADFTLVEYWAEWCKPCHTQFGLLNQAVSAQLNLAINILHVEADPMKLAARQKEKNQGK